MSSTWPSDSTKAFLRLLTKKSFFVLTRMEGWDCFGACMSCFFLYRMCCLAIGYGIPLSNSFFLNCCVAVTIVTLPIYQSPHRLFSLSYNNRPPSNSFKHQYSFNQLLPVNYCYQRATSSTCILFAQDNNGVICYYLDTSQNTRLCPSSSPLYTYNY